MKLYRFLWLLFSISPMVVCAQLRSTPAPQPAQPPARNTQVSANCFNKLTLKISTDQDCLLSIDGESKGTLKVGEVKKICLGKGKFKIEAKSITNSKDIYAAFERVTDKELNSEDFYEIALENITNARLQNQQVAERAKRVADEKSAAVKRALGEVAQNMVPVPGRSYKISKHDLTQALWEAVMATNPSTFKGCSECPVETVSWNEAMEFINKLNSIKGTNCRLPTEAEWEYAARGGSQGHGYDYSGSNDINNVGWYADNSGSKTHPVGQKQANELGLYDMSGNVWQWCSDWYDDSHAFRVIRGGSCGNVAADCCVSGHTWIAPDSRYNHLGFRLAQDF